MDLDNIIKSFMGLKNPTRVPYDQREGEDVISGGSSGSFDVEIPVTHQAPSDEFDDLLDKFLYDFNLRLGPSPHQDLDNEPPAYDFGMNFGEFSMADPHHFIQHFSDLFSRLRGMDSMLGETYGGEKVSSGRGPPRDEMLKHPDSGGSDIEDRVVSSKLWPQHDKQDSDLDGQVTRDNASSLVLPGTRQPENNFISRSFSTFIHRGADGRVEEERVVSHGGGEVERTVKRSVDGRTHSLTTRTDAEGRQETREDMVNIEPGELTEFERRWNTGQGGGEERGHMMESDPSAPPADLPITRPAPLDTNRSGIFNKFFSGLFNPK